MESDFVLSHLQNGSHNIANSHSLLYAAAFPDCLLSVTHRACPPTAPPVGCPLAHRARVMSLDRCVHYSSWSITHSYFVLVDVWSDWSFICQFQLKSAGAHSLSFHWCLRLSCYLSDVKRIKSHCHFNVPCHTAQSLNRLTFGHLLLWVLH